MIPNLRDALTMPKAVHENGFLQLFIPNDERIHIWHPAIANMAQTVSTQLHNHRFGFNSEVLCGRLIDEKYSVKTIEEQFSFNLPPRFRVWFVDRKKGGLTSRNKDGYAFRAIVELTGITTMRVGQAYLYTPGEWHATRGAQGIITATRFGKYETDESIQSAVLCPSNMEPDNSFDRGSLSDTLLERVIKDAYYHMLLEGTIK